MATLSNEDQVEEEETWVGKEGVNYRLPRGLDLVSRGTALPTGLTLSVMGFIGSVLS